MARKRKSEDDDAEALLDELMAEGNRKEQTTEATDDPFLDADGDQKVVPTNEDLSSLVSSEGSVNALPMREILKRNLRVSLRAIEMAEIAYHANPRQGTATALTSMQTMVRDLVKAIEERQDPKELAVEVQSIVLQTLISDFVKLLTSEVERKRSALMTIVPPQSAGVVDSEMKSLMQGVGDGLDEIYDDARRRLEELLCSKIKTGK